MLEMDKKRKYETFTSYAIKKEEEQGATCTAQSTF
jgi:hypothetical protein